MYVEAGILPKSQWLIRDLSKIIAWMGVLGDMLAQRAFAKTPGTHVNKCCIAAVNYQFRSQRCIIIIIQILIPM